jgi:hypothetical protein
MTLLLLLSACHDYVRGSCDPLDDSLCALPYPSSFFLKAADTPSGFQVDFAPDSLPKDRDGLQISPDFMNEKDGFSTLGPLMTWFDDLSMDGVVGHENLADYAAPDAKIVLVDAETGDRVPVWAELDMSARDDSQRLLYIWPAVPLEHARRYVVGLRGLKTNAGQPVGVSDAFQALRDGQRTDDDDIEIQRKRFKTIVFPALEAAGVPQDDLQLAWDFVTVSHQSSVGRMEFMRDDGLARIGDGGPAYTVKTVTDHDCASEPIARDIIVTMTVPMYTEKAGPNTLLTRDQGGMPFYNGDEQVDVLVRVPCSLVAEPHPGPVLQYGHGLLGNKDEAYTGWLSRFANDNGYVVVAANWSGMAAEDVPAISLMIVEDPSNFAIIPERSMQGFFEQVMALRLVDGAFADDPSMTYGGVSVVDRDHHYYYGNSEGSVMGGAYLALSPDLDRGVLGVPGMPYSLLLDRSNDFTPFFTLMRAKYTDDREISFMIESFEALWEPGEAGGYAYDMNRDPPEGMFPKQVLLHAALGDAQVTTLGAEYMARAYGASTIAPETRPIFGVDEQPSGFSGSAIVEWKYADVPDAPVLDTPPDDSSDPHECPRREPAGQEQIRDFLATGVVNQYCDGVCDDHLRSEICP